MSPLKIQEVTSKVFLTLSLGGGGEQIAAVLPGREEVSVVVLSSWEESGETGPSSLSEADSLEDSIDSRAEERRPTWTEMFDIKDN